MPKDVINFITEFDAIVVVLAFLVFFYVISDLRLAPWNGCELGKNTV